MVKHSAAHTSNAALATTNPNLVAVFAGGTAGIGESALLALAANAKSPTAYIVGRNENAAKRIIADCQKLCPDGNFIFLRADLGLLKNVDELCEKIKKKEARLDLLVMSQGYLTFEGRRETSEGIDVLMCLRYYGRMRMLWKFLPLLQKSENAKVVSVFAPGREGKLYLDDLSLRNPAHFGIFSHISHASFMTTFFMEEISRRYENIALIHWYPGLVKTDEFQKGLFPAWFKFFTKWIMLPIITPFAVPVRECGERCLFVGSSGMYPSKRAGVVGKGLMMRLPEGREVAVGSDGSKGSGCYSVNWDGEVIGNEKVYGKLRGEGVGEKIWVHTMRAFEEVEGGRKFEG
jgi:NAD(P)-dependent dehydrogenase (short-subunit alcohol dehydrogenase family)